MKLSEICWHTARLTLQNTRNVCAKEHPLSIFDAIFKFAAHGSPLDYCFHPLTPCGNVIRKGTRYDLELVFPLAAPEECRLFLHHVQEWLEDPTHNFSVHIDSLEQRSPDRPLNESPSGPELCLDFLTPLSLPTASKMLDAAGLFELFARRLRRWYDVTDLDEYAAVFEKVRVLSWFWDYVEFHHRAKSQPGKKYVCGMVGPLYLRGDWEKALPLLIAGQELNIGSKLAAGQGAYRLRFRRPCLDLKLSDPDRYAAALNACVRDNDDPRFELLEDDADFPQRLRDACVSGTWRNRADETTEPAELVARRAAAGMIAPHVRAMLPRLTTPDRQALRRLPDPWLLQVTLRRLPAAILWDRLDEFLPLADTAMRGFLARALAAGAEEGNPGEELTEDRPVVLSNDPPDPLAPLFVALSLGPADEFMAGCLHVDGEIFVPAASREDAQKALDRLEQALADRRIEPDCVAFIERSASGDFSPRRPLHVQELGAFVGVEGDSVLVRRDGKELGRAPLHCVDEIILYGSGGVSSRLVQKCQQENIPLSFCTPSGWHYGTLHPCPRDWFENVARHAARYAALSPAETADIARALVRARIRGALRSLGRELRSLAADALAALERADEPRRIMGVEGRFARAVFPLVNGMINGLADCSDFRSRGRVPRSRPDLWNALLDACYSLLFARLYVRIESCGLNPYLGFLHSLRDRYASLVADMQEPFRHRMDALALRVVNQGVVRPEHFVSKRLQSKGRVALLHAFERELDARHGGGPSLEQCMKRQIDALREWATGDKPLRIFGADEDEDF